MAVNIGTIQPIWDSFPLSLGESDQSVSGRENLPVFADIFQNAIDTVK